MEISPIIMAKMLLVAFLLGAQSGVFFDAGRVLKALFFGEVKSKRVRKLYGAKLPFSKRIFKKSEKRSARIFKNILIFFCDFLWVIYSCFSLMKINYAYNDGGIRFFTVIAMAVGFFLYYFTVSRVAIFLMEVLTFAIKYAFFAIFDAVSLPFLKIYNNLVKKSKKICEKMRLRLEKRKKKVYNVSEIVYENANEENKCMIVKISVRKNKEKGCAHNEEK